MVIALSILLPLAVVGLFVRRSWQRQRVEDEAFERDRKTLLVDANLAIAEEEFGRPAPTTLKALYGNTQLIMSRGLQVTMPSGSWQIELFNPPGSAWEQPRTSNRFGFAIDETGSQYQIDFSQERSKVWLHDAHEDEDQIVADQFTDFIEAMKRALEKERKGGTA